MIDVINAAYLQVVCEESIYILSTNMATAREL